MAQDDKFDFSAHKEPTEVEDSPLAVKLLQEQSMLGLVVGSIGAGIPAIWLYAIFVGMYNYPVIAYVLPGIIIGFTARFYGRGIYFRYQLTTGLITLALLGLINYILTYPSGMVLSLPSIILSMLLSKRKLSHDQTVALARHEALSTPKE